MTPEIGASIASIEAELIRLGRPVVGLLKPGLPRYEIADAIQSRDLAALPDLTQLYRWRNGTNTDRGRPLDDLWLVPGFYFSSLEGALANYDAFVDNDRWEPGWLPILANGGGDFIVQQCSEDKPEFGGIFHFRIETEDHPKEYNSLGEMLATYAAAFENGVFHLDSAGYLEVDDTAFSTLAASLNPQVAWWTSGV